MKRNQYSNNRSTLFIVFLFLSAFIGLSLSGMIAGRGEAAEYNSDEAGHPLRIIAYVGHPVGVILDYVFCRPAYYLVQKEPFATLFGHNVEFGNKKVKAASEG